MDDRHWSVRRRLWVRAAGVLLLGCLPRAAARPDAWQLYREGDYRGFLLAARQGDPLAEIAPFDRAVALAIALHHTDGTPDDLAKVAAVAFGGSADGARWLSATARLLGGDDAGAAEFFAGSAPPFDAWARATKELRQRQCDEAADVFTAVYATGISGLGDSLLPDDLREGVTALSRMPAPRRTTVLTLMERLLTGRWYRLQELSATALRLAVESAGDPPRAALLTKLAVGFGSQPGALSVRDAEALEAAGAKAAAVRCATHVAAGQPNDLDALLRAGRIVARCGAPDETERYYQRLVRELPAPPAREPRLAFMVWLSANGKAVDPATVPGARTALLAADLALVRDDLPTAAHGYRAIATDEAIARAERLDAWAGWLAAEPAAALADGSAWLPKVVDDSGARWVCRQVWQAAQGTSGVGVPHATRRDESLALWAPAAADLLLDLAEQHPVAVLRMDRSCYRAPIAALCAIANKGDRVRGLLTTPIKYERQAPPGGWRNPPGCPPPADAHKPRMMVEPQPGQTATWARETLALLKQLEQAAPDPRVASSARSEARAVLENLAAGR